MTSDAAFSDAGSDEDLQAEYMLDQWQGRRDRARRELARSAELIQSGDQEAAEKTARAALAELRSALNWAEFGPNEEQAHRELDEAGQWVRESFGCLVSREGTKYRQTCPVALAHNRIGLSVGGVATRICSLCGEDLSECPHMRGRSYAVPGGFSSLGWCRVCLTEEACAHSADETYRVSVTGIVRNAEILEVSLVSRPAHPDARVMSMDLDNSELAEALGPDFTPGQDLVCSRCLEPCSGFVRPSPLHG